MPVTVKVSGPVGGRQSEVARKIAALLEAEGETVHSTDNGPVTITGKADYIFIFTTVEGTVEARAMAPEVMLGRRHG